MSNFNKDEIIKVVENLIGDISWHGETYSDEKSLKNRQLMFDIAYELLEHSTSKRGYTGNQWQGSFWSMVKQDNENWQLIKDEFENE